MHDILRLFQDLKNHSTSERKEENAKFNFFATSNVKPDVAQIVWLIRHPVKISIVP